MKKHADITQPGGSQPAALRKPSTRSSSQSKQSALSAGSFVDSSCASHAHGKLQMIADSSPAAAQIADLQAIANEAPVAQLKPDTVKITGLTHLVRMPGNRTTLFGGKNFKTVSSGDLVTIESDVTYKSRRGPNQEDPELRESDRTGEHIYSWFQAKDVNGEAVGTGDVFLRDETFTRAPAAGAYDVEKELLVQQKGKLVEFKQRARGVVSALGEVLDGLQEHPGLDGFPGGIQGVSQAHRALQRDVDSAAPGQLAQVERQHGEISGQMANLHEQLEEQAYAAKQAGEPEMGRNLIAIADRAFRIIRDGERHRASPTGEDIATRNDVVGGAYGLFDFAQTGIHGLGGGIVGTPGVFAAGSFGAGFATGFAYVAGPLGIICGLIGVGLGIRVAWRGYDSEKKLRKLIPTLEQRKVREIAEFAAEKKRKKKWGGAIVITAGVAAVLAGALGIAALSVATLGIGAAILGIGAALIGLGIGIGKLIHRARKRRKWRAKMAALVLAAVDNGERDAFPGNIIERGAAVRRHQEGENDHRIAMKALQDDCVAMAESRRSLLALDAVRFLRDGTPGEKYESTLVIEALKLKPDEVLDTASRSGEDAAASLVARKMRSW
jgi:hypothetical protein